MTAINSNRFQFLFRSVPISPLIAFRIIFGALMLYGTARFMLKGWIEQNYILPRFHFTYLGFEWVKPLHGNWMYLPFILMIVCSLGIIAGFFYRFSALMFALAFTYIELLDKTFYLNHYYFVSLVAFLMIFLPANAAFSIDAKRDPAIVRNEIPAWCILILQFQLGVVYFFAGIAKINSDWLLRAQPLHTWLQAFRDLPVVGGLLAAKWLAVLFAWVSCFYDLSVAFLLKWKKSRAIAYFFVVAFHLITWLLFPIGVFPWVMIFSTLIFFPPEFHDKWLEKTGWKNPSASLPAKSTSPRPIIFTLLIVYVSVQVLIPMRYIVYPGNLFWTEEGFRFSWRVMLMDKDASSTFYVVDKKTGGSIEINNEDYLTGAQIKEMASQPDMVLQYAHFLGKQFSDTVLDYGDQQVHLQRPRVEAEIFVTLNGRPHQLFISRRHDLMEQHYNLQHREWLEPYKH